MIYTTSKLSSSQYVAVKIEYKDNSNYITTAQTDTATKNISSASETTEDEENTLSQKICVVILVVLGFFMLAVIINRRRNQKEETDL